jgi:hypothetical protein
MVYLIAQVIELRCYPPIAIPALMQVIYAYDLFFFMLVFIISVQALAMIVKY